MNAVVVSVCTNGSCRRIALSRCGLHGSYFRLNREALGPTPPSDARCAAATGCEVRCNVVVVRTCVADVRTVRA
jgi:hypothetical protein